jgi:hypothetical protein
VDVRGALVLAESQVDGVTEPAVAGALGEAELSDEPWLDPGDVAGARRIDKGGLPAHQR